MTKPEIVVSPFTIDHYERVFSLWQQCEGVGLGDSDSRDDIDKFLRRNQGMSLITETNNNLSGAILCGHDGRRGYIHHLAVLPKYRRYGIGDLLVNRCLEILKSEKILKCHIFIFNNNREGLKFWQSIGWSYRKDIGVVSKMINPT